LLLLFYIRGGKGMLNELLKAFFFIFMAEMGDKTQILAMTFATKYKVKKVLLGVLIGSALNHGLAIILGYYLSTVIPIKAIQLIAGISFIFFGLWSLKADDGEDEEGSKNNYGAVVTVAMAFFIGELGDKTQLTAITLSTDAAYPVFILMGTVLGMIATSGMGIYLGSKIGEKIPEYAIKFISAGVFLFFGILKLFGNLPSNYITPINVVIFFIVIGIIVVILSKPLMRQIREKRMTPLKEIASTLYINTQKVKEFINNNVCLGTSACGNCEGANCPIGYTKELLEQAEKEGDYIITSSRSEIPKRGGKKFDRYMVREGIINSLEGCLNCGKRHDKNCVMNRTREALELVYFGKTLSFEGSIEDYINEMRKHDKHLAEEIKIRRETKVMK
jgi:Ca2+/H+ antiporter, TMEM165/GDT1 family